MQDLALPTKLSGFTLVELIVVIILMGILAVGTVQFIADSSNGYAATARRSEIGSTARLAVERMARELRDALPNSTRVGNSGKCIELIPVRAASTYLELPLTTSASSFPAVPLEPGYINGGERVAVYPDSSASVYSLNEPGPVSPAVTVSAPDVNNVVTVAFAAPHRFSAESPQNRFFLIEPPVSFCLDGARLWRYASYGFVASQPLPATLPGSLPGRALIGEGVSSSSTAFTLSGATLTRNAVVVIDLDFATGVDSVHIGHVVQLRNVP